ncbi:MAG: isoleucine--tRNA ligase, partial [Rhizobacter sp.]|nr:isoleucine--tRNA ligase [Chlorobiales bacterium]
TVLSQAELRDGYRDVKDPSIYVKFKLKRSSPPRQGSDADEYFLVWTTTPWTLISNVALCVGADIDYARVRTNSGVMILAKSRLSVLGTPSDDNPVEVLEEFKGKSLEGVEYERLFDDVPVTKKAFYLTTGDFVGADDGSGIVHIAPAFGADDYELSKKYNLPMLQPITRGGKFTDEVPAYAGVFFKDADAGIITDLKQRGLLFKKETITHSYPFSWRYDVPVLYYARESWYIRTTEVAAKMIALNKEIGWHPPEIGSGRFGNWLEENKDWALSRERFWGTPLPVWVNEDFKPGDTAASGNMFCIGSVQELREGFINISGEQQLLGAALDNGLVELDLHKPFADSIYFIKGGKKFTRTPELVDVWFDSGSMPFAQLHYPFENKDLFDKSFPADFIAEGIDQTRGWFYTLHAISTMIFGKPAYKNLIVNGHLLDKAGKKMSKSLGNIVDPFEMIARYGADALRWYLVSTSPPWLAKAFDEDDLRKVQNKFFRTLTESYRFFAQYAAIDDFTYSEPQIHIQQRTELDRWIISLLNTLIKEVGDAYQSYDLTLAARLIQDFTVDQLSNWYIRRSRNRFWKGATDDKGKSDKTAAYQTLYECLITVVKLAAPVCPFITDAIYQNLNRVTQKEDFESVHLAFFPPVEETAIDAPLESRMKKAQVVSSLVRTMREKASIKVRQPLRRMLVPVAEPHARRELEKVKSVILDEVNVRAIEYVDDDSGIVNKKAKPNFKILGPKFGKEVNLVANVVKGFSAAQIAEVEKSGRTEAMFNGKTIAIESEDFEVLREDIEGWLVMSDEETRLTVALDTELDGDLIMDGLAREFVSAVQTLRKDTGLEITDRIIISIEGTAPLTAAIDKYRERIMAETLATGIEFSVVATLSTQPLRIDFNGETGSLAISAATKK